jgi:hypothetical protein
MAFVEESAPDQAVRDGIRTGAGAEAKRLPCRPVQERNVEAQASVAGVKGEEKVESRVEGERREWR